MQDSPAVPESSELTATIHGFPRIGGQREIKFACEKYWAGTITAEQLLETGSQLRAHNWTILAKAGLTSVPCNDFSFYDSMLDTAIMLGAIPSRYSELEAAADSGGDQEKLDLYFAMARGNADVEPLEMTKWFDTNYHYLVPEISAETEFSLNLSKQLEELQEVTSWGFAARPILIGPATFLSLAKPSSETDPEFDPFTRLNDLVPLYVDAIAQLHRAGARWIQFDEPIFATDLSFDQLNAIKTAYEQIGATIWRPEILVSTYFGNVGLEGMELLRDLPIEAVGLDFTETGRGNLDHLKEVCGFTDKTLVAGIVNGRNIWKNDLWDSIDLIFELDRLAPEVAISSSCSLLHVPVDLSHEVGLDKDLKQWLAFAVQKVDEIVTLSIAKENGARAVKEQLDESDAAKKNRRARIAELTSTSGNSVAYPDRRTSTLKTRQELQQYTLNLPPLPTTTIGSFPQTPEVRAARAALNRGEISQDRYVELMQQEIRNVIDEQIALGLDVLVHGEPERNDMVQYFAEQLDGFAATANGWVQSYGSRCVRPPILYGPVSRPRPMTVEWSRYAQSLTDRPVKGMLTGPVTILCWSFVRDDQPLTETALEVADAICTEVLELEGAGISVIQVDEPALREGLPLRSSQHAEYLGWATKSFRVATSSVKDETVIHTHMCYAEFGQILPAIQNMDVDVISFEAARSGMEIAEQLKDEQFSAAVGPGVYDIHSPRVPDAEELAQKLRLILKALPAEQVWVNPDCGLKTRKSDETKAALKNLVEATTLVRREI